MGSTKVYLILVSGVIMTVGDLRQLLAHMPADWQVVIADNSILPSPEKITEPLPAGGVCTFSIGKYHTTSKFEYRGIFTPNVKNESENALMLGTRDELGIRTVAEVLGQTTGSKG
jgi:hypothetical protein